MLSSDTYVNGQAIKEREEVLAQKISGYLKRGGQSYGKGGAQPEILGCR